VWFFNGETGIRYATPSFPYNLKAMVSAEVNGDNLDEVIISFNDGSSHRIRTLNPGGSFSNVANYGDDPIWDLSTADILYDDGVDEIYSNVAGQGIRGRDIIGGGSWTFNAPMAFPDYNSKMLIADHDDDGVPDIAYQNYNYLNVLNGSTQDLMWHFYANDSLSLLEIGRFEMPDSPLGAVYYDNYRIKIISGYEISTDPPGFPSPPYPPSLDTSLRTPDIIGMGIIGMGIGLVFAITLKKVKKRR
jgi:hypothetical protein